MTSCLASCDNQRRVEDLEAIKKSKKKNVAIQAAVFGSDRHLEAKLWKLFYDHKSAFLVAGRAERCVTTDPMVVDTKNFSLAHKTISTIEKWRQKKGK